MPEASHRALAIYDMDRTITRRGTFTPFLLDAARAFAPWRLLLAPLALGALGACGVGLITRKRLKEINLALLTGGRMPPDRLAKVAGHYADHVLKANLRPGALVQIAADRAEGRRLVLATASYRLYVEAIAARLGFDDVIATNSVIGLDARVGARIDGDNCYGPAKLRMIEAWCAREQLPRKAVHIRFYSDHASDAPVMSWADEAWAVNPSPSLRRLARARGWPIVDWG